MEEIYEPNWEQCDYCETTYYESDTGYREYGCSFVTGDERDCECLGGSIENCPLAFRYTVENDINC